jgi:BASS family bile acid:Na+ symporter
MDAIQLVGPLALFLLMMVVGLELTPGDFRRVLATPRAVVGGTLGQVLLLPLMTWLVVFSTGVSPVFGAGAILVAVSPGAGISNVLAALARADVALSVSLTAVSSMLAVVSMPFVASIGMRVFLGDATPVEVPVVELMLKLFVSLIVPIVLGMWLRHRFPELTVKYAPILHRVVMGAIALLVILAVLFSEDEQVDFEGGGVALLAALLWTLCAMAMGWGVAALLRLGEDARYTFLIEFSARNVAVAMIVALSGLGRADLTLFAGVYVLVGYPLTAAVVLRRRRRFARELPTESES